jgi:hypothetical protein
MKKKEKDPAAVSLGSRGGKARAKNLTAKQRSDIARKGAAKRWAKKANREGGK